MVLNLVLLILFIAACCAIKDYQKKETVQEDNPYADLEDLMSDDSWARIREPNPPRNDEVEPPHTLVASAGRRERFIGR